MTITINLLPRLDLDKLNADFLYVPDSGVLLWNCVRRGVSRGSIAGNERYAGDSIHVNIQRTRYPVELLVYYMHTQEWPDMIPRHKSGDRTDNRIQNLQLPVKSAAQESALRHMRGATTPAPHPSPSHHIHYESKSGG